MKVKDLSKYSRPREKLERYGVVKLSDHELLAILLGSGVQGTNVIELAKKILKRVSEVGIEEITVDDLTSIKGLGQTKAGQIIAALEFGRRQYLKTPEIIVTPEKVFELCADIRNSRKEHLVAFYLNSRGALIKRETISIGTLDASLVHPREVYEPALQHGAASLVMAHNHPSQNVASSHEDIITTKALRQAGSVLGIELQDHIIVTKDSWASIIRDLD